jgi:hypothetical protein
MGFGCSFFFWIPSFGIFNLFCTKFRVKINHRPSVIYQCILYSTMTPLTMMVHKNNVQVETLLVFLLPNVRLDNVLEKLTYTKSISCLTWFTLNVLVRLLFCIGVVPLLGKFCRRLGCKTITLHSSHGLHRRRLKNMYILMSVNRLFFCSFLSSLNSWSDIVDSIGNNPIQQHEPLLWQNSNYYYKYDNGRRWRISRSSPGIDANMRKG